MNTTITERQMTVLLKKTGLRGFVWVILLNLPSVLVAR